MAVLGKEDVMSETIDVKKILKEYSVMECDHPLIQHKITLMRDKNTATDVFWRLTEEVAQMICYEATRDLETMDILVETPMEETMSPVIAGKKQVIVPIMRAGIEMMIGIRTMIPTSRVGFIGEFRDPETHEPHQYYNKQPEGLPERIAIVTDPMLATGGSVIAAINDLKEDGVNRVKACFIIAAPEGLKALVEAHPDTEIFIGHIDRCLNENMYILPGLGDAGDRIYGTK